MSRAIAVGALAFCLVACTRQGTSTLTITVTSTATIGGVDHLRLDLLEHAHGRSSVPNDFPVAAPNTIPPQQTLAVRLPADLDTEVDVTVTALDANDQPLSSGVQPNVAIAPGHAVALTITLGESPDDLAGVDGSGGDGSTGPGIVDPAQSTLSVDRSSGITADGVDATHVTVVVKDGAGQPMAGQTVALAIMGGGANAGALAPTDATGTTTTTLTSTTAGIKLLTASVGLVAFPSTPVSVTFIAGPASQLAFTVQPSPVCVSTPFKPTVQVSELDAHGNLATTGNDSINITFGTNPASANLIGPVLVKAVNGVANLVPLGVDKIGSGYTLVATGVSLAGTLPSPIPGLMATSSPFDVLPPAWQLVSGSITGGRVTMFAADPFASQTVYAFSNRLYKSTDGGSNWAPADFGLGLASINSMAFHTSGVIFAASANTNTNGVLFRSSDGAASFTPVTQQPFPISSISVDVSNRDLLYLIDGHNSVLYRSVDGGAHVTAATLNMAGYVVAGPSANEVYALADNSVFRSTDGGLTWAGVTTGLGVGTIEGFTMTSSGPWLALDNQAVYHLVAGPAWSLVGNVTGFAVASNPDGSAIYVGGSTTVSRSINSGANWTPITGRLANTPLLGVDTAGDGFGCNNDTAGVQRALIGGTTFAVANQGLTAGASSASYPNNGFLMANTDAGVWRTINGGTSWTPITTPIADVLFLSSPPEYAVPYVVGQGIPPMAYSLDQGDTWLPVSPPPAYFLNGGVDFSYSPGPAPSPTIWLGANKPSDTTGAMIISPDGGKSWGPSLPVGMTTSLPILVPFHFFGKLYAWVFQAGLYLASNDSGTSWSSLTDGTGLQGTLLDAEVNFTTGTFWATDGLPNVYHSTDHGTTWVKEAIPAPTPAPIYAGLPSYSTIAPTAVLDDNAMIGINTETDSTVLARTGSITGPGTWVVADRGLPQTTISVLVFDFGSGKAVYAITSAGIYKSTTNGQ